MRVFASDVHFPSPLLPEGEVGPKGRMRVFPQHTPRNYRHRNEPKLSPLLPEGEVGPKARMRVFTRTTRPATETKPRPLHFSPREKSAQRPG